MGANDDGPNPGLALAALLAELVDGPPEDEAYMLNRSDPGLLGSLERLSWERAGEPGGDGGASVAQHVDHLRYGLSLMNRWAAGEQNPFADADWGASWHVRVSSAEEWDQLCTAFADEAHRWIGIVREMGDELPPSPIALKGIIGSVAHVGYHLGAIRQIASETRGPRDEEIRVAEGR